MFYKFIVDLTLIPPPKTPDEDKLIDFTQTAMSIPPPGFSDDFMLNGEEGLPESVADLPAAIREHIDAVIFNEQDLGGQLATIDALMLSK